MLSQFVDKFVNNIANRQAVKQENATENIISLLEIVIKLFAM